MLGLETRICSICFLLLNLCEIEEDSEIEVHSAKVIVLRSEERYLALSYVWGKGTGNRKRAIHCSLPDVSEHVA